MRSGISFSSSVLSGGQKSRRVVVAHGTDWCMSRFSSGVIDVLALQPDSDVPKVIWHTSRLLSRGDYLPKLKAAGEQFEVQWNVAGDALERRRRRSPQARVARGCRDFTIVPAGKQERGIFCEL